MSKTKCHTLLLCACVAMMAACSKDVKVNTTRFMTAKVDSTTFTATVVTPVLNASSDTSYTLSIAGLNATTGQSIALVIYHYHPVITAYVIDLGKATATYTAGKIGTATSGEIFVDQVTGSTITGRFNFVTDTGNSAVVTNGTFNVATP